MAITSSFHPDDDTHVENVRFGKGSNAMGALGTILVDGGGPLPRPVRFLLDAARHPSCSSARSRSTAGARRTVIGLVMQTRDNSLTVSSRRGLLGGRVLTSRQGHGEPNPTWIPAGHRALVALAGRLAQATGFAPSRAAPSARSSTCR